MPEGARHPDDQVFMDSVDGLGSDVEHRPGRGLGVLCQRLDQGDQNGIDLWHVPIMSGRGSAPPGRRLPMPRSGLAPQPGPESHLRSRSRRLPVIAGGEGAVDVLQPTPAGRCSGTHSGTATTRPVGTPGTNRAVRTERPAPQTDRTHPAALIAVVARLPAPTRGDRGGFTMPGLRATGRTRRGCGSARRSGDRVR